MTNFDEILQEHEKLKLKKIADAAAQAKKGAEERDEFSHHFMAAMTASARPIFTEFVNDARRNGFPASVEDGYDQNGNPYLQVRFFPQRYVVTSVDTSRDCALILMANLAEQQVLANTRFQLWPEKNATHKITFAKHTLSKSTLTRLLYDFMRDALEGGDAV